MIKNETCIFSALMAQKLLSTTPFPWPESCYAINIVIHFFKTTKY